MPINGIKRFAVKTVYGALAVVAVQTFVATPLLSWRLAVGGQGWLEWLVGILFAVLLLGMLFTLRQRIHIAQRYICTLVLQLSTVRWLLLTLLIGISLRLIWVWLYPAAPASDGATYLDLAIRLSHGNPYEMADTYAYWPPGYPLMLAPLVKLFGANRTMLIGFNLTLFAATLFVLYRFGHALGGEVVGRLATLIIAVWPTYIALVGLPEKEQPIILIVAFVMLLLYVDHLQKMWRTLLSGLILGYGCLIQPGLLLLPFAIFLADLLDKQSIRITSLRFLLICLGMFVTILPWTIRNYEVFNQFVLISTNSGDVLYRANNPLATGGYTRLGEIDISDYPEIEKNIAGSILAKQWIYNNPSSFLKLAIEKQILFLGDDSGGVYGTLIRGKISVSKIVYILWKGFANLYWLGLWALIFLLAWRWLNSYQPPPTLALPLVLSFLYFYSLHSIFESSSKYHLPVLGLLALLAALSIAHNATINQKEEIE
jgi:4-amino-4-deoxy-L-arabinose transferase-like glycosyltransferase